MANLRQFNKGETIQITVTPDTGVTMTSPVLYVYPDSLDLNSNPDTSKIIKIDTFTGVTTMTFTIDPTTTGGSNMPAGDYTVELKYGSSNDITVVKQNHAFTLVESGYNKKDPISQ